MFMKILRNIFIGFGICAISMLIFLIISTNYGIETVPVGLMQKQLIEAMLFGAYVGMIAFIFRLKKISLLARTIIHFMLLVIGYSITGLTLGWFDIEMAIFTALSFLIVYVICWIVFYQYNVKIVKALNDLK